ncbi:MAG TPA: hypothetical protein VM260_14920, partial [Pirellula sp.]|nr:hypothetical protein [Pirellula sp.]
MRRVLYILALLDDSDIDWLTIVGERQNIAFGQAIVTERVPIDSLYVILSGKFSVTLEATGIQLNLLSTGEMVG